ncbi:hypothetical protein [Mariniblastus fucicola]|uniref:SCP domain-containing protein n=1 Tax=Mariniblastus fucicola TaxID=980251 RepID=A0A5B9PDY7_9BACT|nr:hypothetical protein [Mariniblastus fucicola]QEG23152.1 hypothetical protein MFFC18_30470 [Mariniblastus fucicola]
MIYRNLTNVLAVAMVAALLSVGASGNCVVAQQYIGSGSTPCASCSQSVNFSSTNVSSTPQMTSSAAYPVGQVVYSSSATQTLPATASFPGSVVSATYQAPVNETFATYPAANQLSVATATTAVPGTLTALPAAPYAAAPTPVAIQPARYSASRSTPVRSTLSTGYQAVSNGVGAVTSGLAQRKAQQAARAGIRGHIGGGLGGARYEGVGWSSQSAQAAIQQCCYWGQRPTAEIGVSRGADGLWYACVLYN